MEKTRCSSPAPQDIQPGCGPRRWRYQPVWQDDRAGRLCSLCEVWIDSDERLSAWTESAEMRPSGEDPEELGRDLVRMYVDAVCWRAVAFDSLRVGMKFERLVSKEQREGIAQMFDAFPHAFNRATDGACGTKLSVEHRPSTKQQRVIHASGEGRAMKCCICQKGVDDVGALYRVNAKGVPGIYACRQHVSQTDAPTPDAEVAEIASILAPAGKGTDG